MPRLLLRPFLWTFILPVVAFAAGFIASTLYFKQGGFGGGHGEYDQAIGYLGMPGLWIIDQLPEAYYASFSDYNLIVVVPCLINILIAVIVGFALDLVLRRILRK